jgi:hypothetical protein
MHSTGDSRHRALDKPHHASQVEETWSTKGACSPAAPPPTVRNEVERTLRTDGSSGTCSLSPRLLVEIEPVNPSAVQKRPEVQSRTASGSEFLGCQCLQPPARPARPGESRSRPLTNDLHHRLPRTATTNSPAARHARYLTSNLKLAQAPSTSRIHFAPCASRNRRSQHRGRVVKRLRQGWFLRRRRRRMAGRGRR